MRLNEKDLFDSFFTRCTVPLVLGPTRLVLWRSLVTTVTLPHPVVTTAHVNTGTSVRGIPTVPFVICALTSTVDASDAEPQDRLGVLCVDTGTTAGFAWTMGPIISISTTFPRNPVLVLPCGGKSISQTAPVIDQLHHRPNVPHHRHPVDGSGSIVR